MGHRGSMNFLKNFTKTILFFLILFLIFLLNIKFLALNSNKVKDILEKSNSYSVVVVGLQETIVKNNIAMGDGGFIEAISEVINEGNIRKFATDIIDQGANILNNKNSNAEVAVKYSIFKKEIINEINKKTKTPVLDIKEFPQDTIINFKKSPALTILRNFNWIIYGTALLVVVLSLTILSFKGTKSSKLISLGKIYLSTGIFFLLNTLILFILLSKQRIESFTITTDVENSYYLQALRRIFSEVISWEKNFTLTVTIILLILSISLLCVGRAIKPTEKELLK